MASRNISNKFNDIVFILQLLYFTHSMSRSFEVTFGIYTRKWDTNKLHTVSSSSNQRIGSIHKF